MRIQVLAALLCAAPAAAYTEPPDRYSLPPAEPADAGSSVPESATWAELKSVVLGGTTAEKVRADALDRLVDRLGSAEQAAPKELKGWTEDALVILEELLEKEADEGFRRHAFFRLFGNTTAVVRDFTPFHPEAAWAPKAWKRLSALKERGLRDRDRRLAESLERFVPLKGGPAWEPVKAAMKARVAKTGKERPEWRAVLEKILGLCQKIEDGQRTVSDRLLAALRKKKAGKDRERLFRQTFEYRMYSNWANMLPRAVDEQLGSDEAARQGFKFEPVKLGWPEF